jgi:hypothetical protein
MQTIAEAQASAATPDSLTASEPMIVRKVGLRSGGSSNGQQTTFNQLGTCVGTCEPVSCSGARLAGHACKGGRRGGEADVAQQAGNQAKQTASSMAADATQGAMVLDRRMPHAPESSGRPVLPRSVASPSMIRSCRVAPPTGDRYPSASLTVDDNVNRLHSLRTARASI